MGKSKGGGEEAARPTTVAIIRHLAQQLKEDKREPASIRVQRVTEGLYAVEIVAHGEQDPEAYMLRLTGERPALDDA